MPNKKPSVQLRIQKLVSMIFDQKNLTRNYDLFDVCFKSLQCIHMKQTGQHIGKMSYENMVTLYMREILYSEPVFAISGEYIYIFKSSKLKIHYSMLYYDERKLKEDLLQAIPGNPIYENTIYLETISMPYVLSMNVRLQILQQLFTHIYYTLYYWRIKKKNICSSPEGDVFTTIDQFHIETCMTIIWHLKNIPILREKQYRTIRKNMITLFSSLYKTIYKQYNTI